MEVVAVEATSPIEVTVPAIVLLVESGVMVAFWPTWTVAMLETETSVVTTNDPGPRMTMAAPELGPTLEPALTAAPGAIDTDATVPPIGLKRLVSARFC